MKTGHLVLLAILAGLAALFSLPAGPALGATFTVTKTADTNDGACNVDCSLREAVVAANAAGGADTITVPAGTYTLTIAGAGEDAAATGDLDITGNLTITGAATSIIDGGVLDRVLHVTGAFTVNISAVTVRNGSESLSGGGIYNAGSLTLTSTTVSSNSAAYGAAIINKSGGSLTLNSSTLSGNTASQQGGGILNESNGTLTLNGSTVSNNSATSSGGGIVNGGTATLDSTTVSGNVVSGDGGGISNTSSGSLTLNSSTVSGNVAGAFGGGIYAGGSLIINSSTISYNSATSSGGGIYNGGTTTLSSSTITGNGASNQGGGIDNAGTLTLSSSTVSGSSAPYGGGMINKSGGSLTLNNSILSGNTASHQGGGILNEGGAGLNVNSSTVSNNSATSTAGGGIVNGGTATLDSTTVSNNSAPYGGGIFNDGGTATLNSSTLSGNTAPSAGGGIYYAGGGGSLTFNSSTVSGNATGSFGGGIYAGGSLTINSSTISYNSAYSSNGGGIYHPAGTTSIQNSIVANSPSGGNCAPPAVASNGFNLSSDGTCAFGALGDMNNTDPKLGPLAFNGGPTPTHALLDGSPAADAGIIPCPPPATDQRGVSRPQGFRCDIGAYEAPDTDADGVGDPLDVNDDNDNLIDIFDPCPLNAEDLDGFQDTDGCPDPDNDSDGICDAGQTSVSCTTNSGLGDTGKMCFDPAGTLSCPTQDCRSVAEDLDAFHDSDGCPEPDNDNDGHPDISDMCPGTDSQTGGDGMLGSPQDLNHNGIKDLSESPLTTDDVVLTFEDYDGVIDVDGCHDSPGDDFDGDGFTDEREQLKLGTNPMRGCPLTTTANDEDPDPWPPDADDDRDVDVGDVIRLFGDPDGDGVPIILQPAAYTPRSDFDADGDIDVGDVINAAFGRILTHCVAP
ncbi:MAG TPA: choice-of-anchor Q domain-containing protein [Dehalococcoidia bacterium]|nr:choice-of-anchor Q domain-containing protein [Dehalococcoidia bacterium]